MAAIGDYTLSQLQLFARESAEIDRQAARVALIVARASQAEQKDFKKILKEFS